MYAVKGNKQLKIEEAEKATYLKLGYDIAEVNGDALEVIETSPKKTVAFSEHQKVVDENKALKEKLKKGKQQELLDENKALKEKVAELEKELKDAGGK